MTKLDDQTENRTTLYHKQMNLYVNKDIIGYSLLSTTVLLKHRKMSQSILKIECQLGNGSQSVPRRN